MKSNLIKEKLDEAMPIMKDKFSYEYDMKTGEKREEDISQLIVYLFDYDNIYR